MLLLGGIAAVAVTQLPSTSDLSATTSTTHRAGVTGTTKPPVTSPPATSSALIAACVADYATVAGVLSDYEALRGAAPPAGTAWATSKAPPGPYLQSWPQVLGSFSIHWNGTSLVVVPSHGDTSVGSSGTATPPSGCEAL